MGICPPGHFQDVYGCTRCSSVCGPLGDKAECSDKCAGWSLNTTGTSTELSPTTEVISSTELAQEQSSDFIKIFVPLIVCGCVLLFILLAVLAKRYLHWTTLKRLLDWCRSTETSIEESENLNLGVQETNQQATGDTVIEIGNGELHSGQQGTTSSDRARQLEADQPGTEQLGVGEPGTEQPGVGEPSTEQPGVGEPGTEQQI